MDSWKRDLNSLFFAFLAAANAAVAATDHPACRPLAAGAAVLAFAAFAAGIRRD